MCAGLDREAIVIFPIRRWITAAEAPAAASCAANVFQVPCGFRVRTPSCSRVGNNSAFGSSQPTLCSRRACKPFSRRPERAVSGRKGARIKGDRDNSIAASRGLQSGAEGASLQFHGEAVRTQELGNSESASHSYFSIGHVRDRLQRLDRSYQRPSGTDTKGASIHAQYSPIKPNK